jgi:hypothetical protein
VFFDERLCCRNDFSEDKDAADLTVAKVSYARFSDDLLSLRRRL